MKLNAIHDKVREPPHLGLGCPSKMSFEGSGDEKHQPNSPPLLQ
jgi:hypothetical protein